MQRSRIGTRRESTRTRLESHSNSTGEGEQKRREPKREGLRKGKRSSPGSRGEEGGERGGRRREDEEKGKKKKRKEKRRKKERGREKGIEEERQWREEKSPRERRREEEKKCRGREGRRKRGRETGWRRATADSRLQALLLLLHSYAPTLLRTGFSTAILFLYSILSILSLSAEYFALTLSGARRISQGAGCFDGAGESLSGGCARRRSSFGL